jgi:hypothetical protein
MVLAPAGERVQDAEYVGAGRRQSVFVTGAPAVAVRDADEEARLDQA